MERISSYEIEGCIQEALIFDYGEIAQFLVAYNLPSWPKSLKATKLDMIEMILTEKVECLRIVGCSYSEIKDFSRFLVSKCLYTCDIAEYAQKIPLIGRLIKIGKFPLVLSAIRSATKEYAKRRNYNFSIEESQEYAKRVYWDDILDSISMFL